MIVDAVIRIGCIWEKHGVKLKNIFQNEKPRQADVEKANNIVAFIIDTLAKLKFLI